MGELVTLLLRELLIKKKTIPLNTVIINTMDKQYDIIITDADGTLADSKMPIGPEMAEVIAGVLRAGKTFAVISGGQYSQLRDQVINRLPEGTPMDNLYVLPTSGTRMRDCDDEGFCELVFAYDFTNEEKQQIREAFDAVLSQNLVDFGPEVWGERLEDRSASFAFSALGQQAPIKAKEAWDPDREKRTILIEALQPLLPNFELKYGGSTTIDVSKQGMDKEFGINEFFRNTDLDKTKALFIGDTIYPGGNDYPATKTGIDCIKTSGPIETVEILRRQY